MKNTHSWLTVLDAPVWVWCKALHHRKRCESETTHTYGWEVEVKTKQDLESHNLRGGHDPKDTRISHDALPLKVPVSFWYSLQLWTKIWQRGLYVAQIVHVFEGHNLIFWGCSTPFPYLKALTCAGSGTEELSSELAVYLLCFCVDLSTCPHLPTCWGKG